MFPVQSKPIHRILLVLLALVAFSLPFKDQFLVNFFSILSASVWVLSNPFKQLFAKRENAKSLLAIVIFYLLHLTALLYTKNYEEGFFSLEIKATLFIFPLIFYSVDYTAKQNKFLLKNFISGCLLCCFLCIGHSSYVSITESRNYFFYQDLSWFQHPSYLSMYLTFCCVAIFEWKLYAKAVQLGLTLFFTIFVLFLSSKSGIVIHFVFLSVYFVSAYIASGSYKKLFLFSGSAILLVILVVLFVPQVKDRFQNVVSAFQSEKVDKSATESTVVRMLIWNEAIEIIKQNPLLGVSPGDANDALYASYKQNGLTGAFGKKLNAHSQYFQTGVGLGIIGLLSFLSLFLVPLFKNRMKLLVFFLLITLVNFLTESMLQTMAGCIFFGYFYAMLCFKKPESENLQPITNN